MLKFSIIHNKNLKPKINAILCVIECKIGHIKWNLNKKNLIIETRKRNCVIQLLGIGKERGIQ